MAAERLSMRHIKDVLRLKFEAQLSLRQIARSLKIGLGTTSLYINRAKAAGVNWPLPQGMDEAALEKALFPNIKSSTQPGFVEPNYVEIHQELKNKGVTKQLLWEEYKQSYGEKGYQYSQYCHRYRLWVSKQQRSMRQIHKAGEKLFIDYCGPTMPIVNPSTGEIRETQIFVAVFGASNYTYALASWTQRKADWIDAHVKAFEFFF